MSVPSPQFEQYTLAHLPAADVPLYQDIFNLYNLKQAGKIYSYFTYPGEGHGFTQRDHRLDAWRRELAFLQRYMGGQDDPASSAGPAVHQ